VRIYLRKVGGGEEKKPLEEKKTKGGLTGSRIYENISTQGWGRDANPLVKKMHRGVDRLGTPW